MSAKKATVSVKESRSRNKKQKCRSFPGHEQRMKKNHGVYTIWYIPEIILKGDYEGETSD